MATRREADDLRALGAALEGGTLDVYAGPAPDGPDAPLPAQAALLVRWRFQERAFSVAPTADGTVVLTANRLIPEGAAQDTGAPSFWRAAGRDGTPLVQGTAGGPRSRAELTFGAEVIGAGTIVALDSFRLRAA